MNFDRETMPGWRNLPSPSTLPDRPFEIDYVRSWKKVERAKSDDDAADVTPSTIFMVLADDVGWPAVGYHRPAGYRETATPTIDALVRSGIEPDRHYTAVACTPTRCALQSGRNPIHVSMSGDEPVVRNPHDTVAGFAGIPVAMEGVAEKMAAAGWRTGMSGKWVRRRCLLELPLLPSR